VGTTITIRVVFTWRRATVFPRQHIKNDSDALLARVDQVVGVIARYIKLVPGLVEDVTDYGFFGIVPDDFDAHEPLSDGANDTHQCMILIAAGVGLKWD
jgi:hypothetical protein